MNNKILIEFLNSEIRFGKNINKADYSKIYSFWEKIILEYNYWLSNFKKIHISKNENLIHFLKWNDFSLWWINNLCRKDTELNNQWIKRIFVVYLVDYLIKNKASNNQIGIITDDYLLKNSLNRNFSNAEFSLRFKFNKKFFFKYYLSPIINFIQSFNFFINTIIKVIILKFFKKNETKSYKNKKNLWFITYYPLNWIENINDSMDRHLHHIPTSKKLRQNFENIAYLAYVNSFFKNIKQIFHNQKKTNNIYYVESHIKIKDIFSIFFRCYVIIFRFLFKKKKQYKKSFKFLGLDFVDILDSEFRKSFWIDTQYYMMHGVAQSNFFNEISGKNKVITYDELWLQSRVGYYFSKKKNNPEYVALQHSLNCKTYGACFNHYNDFNECLSTDISFCPSPHLFLVQGEHYKKLLSEFYPINKIKIVGNLKCKQYQNALINKNNSYEILSKKYNLVNKDIILLTLSSKDSEYLINMIVKIRLHEDQIIIITPHKNSNFKFIDSILKNKQNIFFEESIKTWDIIPHSDIVICGYSNLVYETSFFKLNSAMYIPLGTPPTIPIDDKVKRFFFKEDLFNYIFNREYKSKKPINYEALYNHYYGCSNYKDIEEKICANLNF